MNKNKPEPDHANTHNMNIQADWLPIGLGLLHLSRTSSV